MDKKIEKPKYSDAELLEMWRRGWSQEDLVKLLRGADKELKIAEARSRIERIVVPESFRLAGKPTPKEWQ